MADIPFSYAKRHGIVVTAEDNKPVSVYYVERPELSVIAEIQRKHKSALSFVHTDAENLNKLLVKTYETDSGTAMQMAENFGEDFNLEDLINELPKTEDLMDLQDDAPIIRLLNALLSQAIKENASDVHIETFENELIIRFRVDGILHETLHPQRILAPLITSRVKVMAKLDIAEKRLPQDGRIALKIAGRQVDVRVSTMPTSHGERIVLRLLDKDNAKLDLTSLGMPQEPLELFRKLIHEPHGIILVTGPTGSGKTTTLYAALTELNEKSRNILTVEDPIEYYLQGVAQTQVNTKIDMTFARSLRSMLRQDPDIVMVGEIRDLETAEIAVQASLTGHLVLSTLHTNSAVGAITRLHDMGIEPFLLSSSLIGVLAQRLVRRLCTTCKKAMPATESECALLGLDPTKQESIYHAVGCTRCRTTGYSGRTGIYELIAVDEHLRSMIHTRKSEIDLKNEVRKHFPSIRDDGFRRVRLGDTTLEEVLRVTAEEE